MENYQSEIRKEFLEASLQRMAGLSLAILKFGIAGDEPNTRASVDKMRQLKAELNDMDAATKDRFDHADPKAAARIQGYLEEIKKSSPFVDAWVRRYDNLLSEADLKKTEDGRNALLDRLIPETWNWEQDIILVNQNLERGFIDLLIQRGQRRIVCFLYKESLPEARVEQVQYISKRDECYFYFQNLDSGKPNRSLHFNVADISDSLITDENRERLEELKQQFTSAWKSFLVNINTVHNFGNRWLMQGLQNLPYIAECPSITMFSESFQGMPLVIISPGPSLEKNIQYLTQLKGKALLIATAQVALALSANQVYPDLVVVADPADILYLIDGFPIDKIEALLVGVSCHPEFFRKYQDKIITFNVNSGIDNWLSDIFDDTANIGSGGSVSTAIFALSTFLKTGPVILVGQDLALTGGKQYVSQSADGNMTLEFNQETGEFSYLNVSAGYDTLMNGTSGAYREKIRPLPGYYGGEVESKADYIMFHTEFENHAAAERNRTEPRRLMNCTEGGAYINGFEHIPLTQAIQELNEIHNPANERSIPNIFQDVRINLDVSARRVTLKRKLDHIRSTLAKCSSISKRGRAVALNAHRSKQQLDLLNKVDQDLRRELKHAGLISLSAQEEIKLALEIGLQTESLTSSINASRLLYEIVIREAKKVLPLVESALDRTKPYQRSTS